MEFGPYRIVKRLASGGMGEVFLATLQRVGGFQKEVAVKSIHPKYMTNPRFIEFFEREARLAALLNHRHIVQIFDFGRDDNRVWLAMEYVDGVDLKTVMNESAQLPLRLTLDIIQAVAQALDYAHRARDSSGKRLEIVHRDISPQNILLSFEGDVKVADFGLAHAAALGPDEDRSLKGKYAYMSPEQVMGNAVDARTDQFSLGTVFYEMLTGIRAFYDKSGPSEMLLKVHRGIPGEGFGALRTAVPSVVADIVERALKTNRTERYPDLGAMVDELRKATRSLADEAPPMDLSDWLQQLFPNRQVLVSAATVETTRTTLAQDPIAKGAHHEKENKQTEEALDPVALGLATTGPHKTSHHDLKQLSQPSSNPRAMEYAESTQSSSQNTKVTPGRSAIIVLASASITALLLSVWVYIKTDDVSKVSTPSAAVISATQNATRTEMTKDVGRAYSPSDSMVLPEPAKDVGVSIDIGLPKHASQTTPSNLKVAAIKPVKRIKRKRSKPRRAKPTVDEPRRVPLERDAGIIVIGTDAAVNKVSSTSTSQGVDASIPGLKTPAVPSAPAPQLSWETSAFTLNTNAAKLGPNQYSISESGTLFRTEQNGVKIMMRFAAPRGRFLMTIQTQPWTNVFVNGKELGGTPLASFPLGSGRHLIKVESEAGAAVSIPLKLSR